MPRINYALDKVIDLFIELGANDEQMNFPCYLRFVKIGQKRDLLPDLEKMENSLPLIEAVLKYIPSPEKLLQKKEEFSNPDAPLQIMIVSIKYDNYKGRTGIGRIYQGKFPPKNPPPKRCMHISHQSRREKIQTKNNQFNDF